MDIIQELYNFNPWWESPLHLKEIRREKYLKLLKDFFYKKDIIVLTGLRRVGKTTLLKLFINELLKNIHANRILYISLDSYSFIEYDILNIVELFRKEHKIPRKEKIYFFFDEVTYKSNFHLQLKNLYDNENIKIYCAASSATILNDPRGHLTGRARYIEILPLDFHEFLKFRNIKIKKSEKYLYGKYFEEYMKLGGIPEYILTGDPSYLDALIDNIIFKDIVGNYGVKEISILKDFFRLLMERAGKIMSLNKLSKILNISPDTSKRYFDYFKQTFLIYDVERCGKLNERIKAPKKIYIADVGIKNHIVGFRDKGSIFENLFFLKIKNFSPCYIYKEGLEIDFKIKDTIIEVKFNDSLQGKQKELFDKLKAKKKIVIKDFKDYLNY